MIQIVFESENHIYHCYQYFYNTFLISLGHLILYLIKMMQTFYLMPRILFLTRSCRPVRRGQYHVEFGSRTDKPC